MSNAAIGVRVMGGLGNQMFQYACGLSLSVQLNLPLVIDCRELVSRELSGRVSGGVVLRSFDLPFLSVTQTGGDLSPFQHLEGNFGGRSKNRLGNYLERVRGLTAPVNRLVTEKSFSYDPNLQKRANRGAYLVGYWQSPKYFSSVHELVRKEFSVNQDLLPKTILDLTKRIQGEGGVCLNVRRSDFVNHSPSAEFHGAMSLDYYMNGLDEVFSSNRKSKVFIFSDDPDWCREVIEPRVNAETISHDYSGPGFSHYLFLMQHCRAFVIPNSTFGWWAAWLAQSKPDLVVAPKSWFKSEQIPTIDLIPTDWKRI